MAKNVLHVVPQEEHWAVKKEGNERVSSTHETQKEAIDSARELAKEGDNLVIHRPDGTIRERTTYYGANGVNGSTKSGSTSFSSSEIKAQDVLSVGSRVSWAAVVAGVVVAMAVYATLTMLAIAVGITTVDQVQNRTFAVSAAVVMTFSMLASLFLGGFVASRTTAGETQCEAMIYGLLVWGTLFALTAISGSGMAMGYGVLQNNADQPVAEITTDEKLPEQLGLTEEQQQKYEELRQEADTLTANVTPETLAWTGFGGMILSIFAAIGGALAGAGPELVLKRRRGSLPEVAEKS